MRDLHVELRQECEKVPVIKIAAGPRQQITGHSKSASGHAINASYQARATWDSCSVTRIFRNSLPPGPNAPESAARANASKIYFDKYSVVVSMPLNCDRLSRF